MNRSFQILGVPDSKEARPPHRPSTLLAILLVGIECGVLAYPLTSLPLLMLNLLNIKRAPGDPGTLLDTVYYEHEEITVAVFMAMGAGIAFWLYFRHRRRQLRDMESRK